jgi:hypothetical protein
LQFIYQEDFYMKKILIIAFAMLVITSLAVAQNYTPGVYKDGTGIPFNIDKLGAHQNGGRGCVGCHAPHSGGRGNGGVLKYDTVNGGYITTGPISGNSGDEVLWGQDLGPIYAAVLNFPSNPDSGASGTFTIDQTLERQVTGIAMCLSCHDGMVSKGAMMTNRSFEQEANLLPAGYGTQPIPTLLGADGGQGGNYGNDHPVGTAATLGSVGHGAIGNCSGSYNPTGCTPKNWFVLNTDGTIGTGSAYANSAMAEFAKNYGLPTITGARSGAGWATDASTSVDDAYVVCTTCHTPHSMYTASMVIPGTGVGYNALKPTTKGTYPSYFFIAAPYNPGANVAGGTKASSATQFCRQCHFSGPGGANEGSGISIPTAF